MVKVFSNGLRLCIFLCYLGNGFSASATSVVSTDKAANQKETLNLLWDFFQKHPQQTLEGYVVSAVPNYAVGFGKLHLDISRKQMRIDYRDHDGRGYALHWNGQELLRYKLSDNTTPQKESFPNSGFAKIFSKSMATFFTGSMGDKKSFVKTWGSLGIWRSKFQNNRQHISVDIPYLKNSFSLMLSTSGASGELDTLSFKVPAKEEAYFKVVTSKEFAGHHIFSELSKPASTKDTGAKP